MSILCHVSEVPRETSRKLPSLLFICCSHFPKQFIDMNDMPHHLLPMLLHGLAAFVKTLWALQERRWSYTFDAVASVTVSVTMSLALCFLSIRTTHTTHTHMAFASF
ncbi:hypothetical protein RJT34_30838 [Clitoria ternatea]|uniref:Uncharacterized protein n=1 Tax=Clitoria ternatea TaxID=43366 RepID=A0AAN9EVB4_CLITE